MEYQVLHFFESIRNPALSGLFYFATIFLGGTISVFIGLYLYWCHNKQYGIWLCLNIAMSGTIVQVIKIFCKIDRPWILYPSLHPINNTLINATGYSFPSAHSQQATALFVTLAFMFTGKNAPEKFKKHKHIIRILCVVSIIIVGLSRLYFGIHTPKDVLSGIGISLIVCIIVNIVYTCYLCDKKALTITIISITSFLGIIATFIVYIYNIAPYLSINDTLKLCAAFVGFAVGFAIEDKYSLNEVDGTFFKHILKIIFGLLAFLIIEKGIKFMCHENFFSDFMRYFFAMMFLGSYYPSWFNKLFNKHTKHTKIQNTSNK